MHSMSIFEGTFSFCFSLCGEIFALRFLLSALLLPRLEQSPAGRIVYVSAKAHESTTRTVRKETCGNQQVFEVNEIRRLF